MCRQGGTICLWSFSVLAAVAVLFARGQKPIPHGCDLERESKGASKCARENFKGKFDQVMAEKLIIGCITGNLTIAEFRNRCREPPLAGRVVRCVGGTLPQIKFVEPPSMQDLATFQNCVVKNIYPKANLFR
uniref:Putative conserved secreted protein n=1 Tax=Rhipicephalus microplus TaxID=6941 RepID=A0A6G5A2H2_RHIMP